VTPNTPLEERETRKKIVTTSMENIMTLSIKCAQLYIDTMGVWAQLNEYNEQQEIG
jgi:hypothetical protein